MITRRIQSQVVASLSRFPVVGLVGARQVGKTTLARKIARGLGEKAIYLDLERPSDLIRLEEPELYLDMHRDKLVILDEIHRKPGLNPLLRSLVDDRRRNGRFLLLGSASPDVIRQSSETLAGRIIYHEMRPLGLADVRATGRTVRRLWLRGGFPLSYLARSDASMSAWLDAFIATHLERDIPAFGSRVPAVSLRRFWQMAAHFHGQIWNGSRIAAGLGLSVPTVRSYLDLLEDTFMVRQLQPYSGNIAKRLVKSPKVYVRDTGILHSLLRIGSTEDLLGHPVVGPSWEGWVIEQVLALAPRAWTPCYYRTSSGAEIDLVLDRGARKPLLAVEIKYAASPSLSRGFWEGLKDLGNVEAAVVCMCRERFPLGRGVTALPVAELPRFIDEAAK
jgi:predicted AAA+ superfamily ATPase